MSTLPPHDLVTDGTDFSDDSAVTHWCESLHSKLSGYDFVFFHVAPPCASFSRARDRNRRTRLRCSAHPAGWYPDNETTIYGNNVARNTARAVNYLLDNFAAAGSWEQPLGSYMFPYLESIGALQHEPSSTVVLHQCRFGRPFRKPTVFACFGGLRLHSLDRRCTPSSPCGRPWHQTLGFGSTPTAPAAEYPSALCVAYAADLAAQARRTLSKKVLEDLVVQTDGIVHRHSARGASKPSTRELRAREDAVSRAGAWTTITFFNQRGVRTKLKQWRSFLTLFDLPWSKGPWFSHQALGTATTPYRIGLHTPPLCRRSATRSCTSEGHNRTYIIWPTLVAPHLRVHHLQKLWLRNSALASRARLA